MPRNVNKLCREYGTNEVFDSDVWPDLAGISKDTGLSPAGSLTAGMGTVACVLAIDCRSRVERAVEMRCIQRKSCKE